MHFETNVASLYGGAIYVGEGSLTVSGTTTLQATWQQMEGV